MNNFNNGSPEFAYWTLSEPEVQEIAQSNEQIAQLKEKLLQDLMQRNSNSQFNVIPEQAAQGRVLDFYSSGSDRQQSSSFPAVEKPEPEAKISQQNVVEIPIRIKIIIQVEQYGNT